MSGLPKRRSLLLSSRVSVAVVAAAMQALACTDTSEPSAPQVNGLSVTLDRPRIPPASVTLAAPVFDLDVAPDGSLLAAIASAGVARIRGTGTELIAPLPGVNGVAALGGGEAVALTGGSLDPSQIFPTLSDVLAALQSGNELSPAITFITGPSRTADIELTLAIGVHGPQELYVVIIQNN